jgi:translation initiation factor eIF-2B subunit alpha
VTSVSSGCELFLRFITLKADYVRDFDDCRRQLQEHGGRVWAGFLGGFFIGRGRLLLTRSAFATAAAGHVFLKKAMQGREKIARKGAPFIRDGAVVLTHSRSRVVLSVLTAAARAQKRFSVVVTETRPSCTGIDMARLLAEAGIPVTLIPVGSRSCRPGGFGQVYALAGMAGLARTRRLATSWSALIW